MPSVHCAAVHLVHPESESFEDAYSLQSGGAHKHRSVFGESASGSISSSAAKTRRTEVRERGPTVDRGKSGLAYLPLQTVSADAVQSLVLYFPS